VAEELEDGDEGEVPSVSQLTFDEIFRSLLPQLSEKFKAD